MDSNQKTLFAFILSGAVSAHFKADVNMFINLDTKLVRKYTMNSLIKNFTANFLILSDIIKESSTLFLILGTVKF